MLNKITNTFGTKLIAAIINLLIAIVISQVLGTDGKGQQGLILASIAYILVFSNLIGGAAIVYLTPRHSYSLVLVPSYIWSLLIGVISYFILHFTKLLPESFVLAICSLSVVNALIGINTNILIGKEKIKTANIISLIQPILIIITIALLFFQFNIRNISTYLIALYVSFGFSFIYSLILIGKHCGKFQFHTYLNYFSITKQLIQYGILNQLAHLFQLFSFRLSYYWLNGLYTESEVGIYSNGVSLIESVWIISRSISLVQYSQISNTNDKYYAQKLSLNLTKIGLILSFFILIPIILLPSSFYIFLFGEGFGDVSYVIRSLAPGVFILNISFILGHYFSGIAKYQINTMASFMGLIVIIILFNYLIPSYGIMGAAWASSISYTITSFIVLYYFIKDSSFTFREYLISKNDIILLIRHLKNK